MAVSTYIVISADHDSAQVGEAVNFFFDLLDSTGKEYCHQLLACPGYDCDGISGPCSTRSPSDGWSFITIKTTSPTGVVNVIQTTANFFMYDASILQSFNEVGNWTVAIRYEGEVGYWSDSGQLVDNTRFLQSNWATMTFPVYTNQVKTDVVFSNVTINPSSVPVSGTLTVSGTLKDTTGAAVSGAQLSLGASLYSGVSVTTFSTNSLGNFTATFSVCVGDPDRCAGSHWVQVVFDGDGLHNSGASLQLPFTISGTADMSCMTLAGTVFPPGSVVGVSVALYYPDLSYMVGETVSIQIVNTTTQAIIYNRTITTLNGPWTDNPIINTAGTYEVRYAWAGDANYLATSCSSGVFTVGNCNAPVYYTCPDESQIKTYDCVNYALVPTGESCSAVQIPTSMTCDATNLSGNGATGEAGDVFSIQAHIVANGTPVAGVPINAYLRRPSDGNLVSWATLVTGSNGSFVKSYTALQVGIYYVHFEWNGGGVGPANYGPSSCDVQFEVVPCYSGDVLATFTCPDGSVIDTVTCVNNQPYETGYYCPGQECRGAHPTPECQNGNVWDCVENTWVDLDTPCGPCLTAHPTEQCINDQMWACQNDVWTNTGVACCTQDKTQVCADGSMVTLKRCIGGQYINTGESCPQPKDTTMVVLIGGAVAIGIGAVLIAATRKH